MRPYAYLIVDTETNQLPDYKLPADHPDQPRLCGITMIPVLAASLQESWFNEQTATPLTALIKPDGWTIAPEITAINGLTTERCEAEGMPIRDLLADYTAFIELHYVVVAYNAQFDCKVMRGELRRAGMPDLFEETLNICTMQSCAGLGIKKAGDTQRGFPKLADVYRHFYQAEPAEMHNSRADAITCLMVFRKLMELGVCQAPTIHRAKNHEEIVKAGRAP